MKARVRGVYTTALTKLLLEQGFSIVQASATIIQRFKLDQNNDSPDLDVFDRRDRQGIRVLGKADPMRLFTSVLQSRLDDVIVREWMVTVDGIYKGLVKEVDSATHTVFVDIGSAIGRIHDPEIASYAEEQSLLVQVERWRLGSREPTLTTQIKIPGTHAVLIPGRQVKMSRKIMDWQKRAWLRQLGEELATENWGILWRTSAANQSSDVLRNEIATLMKKGETIMRGAEHVEAPAMVWEGNRYAGVEFPAMSKNRLDAVRRTVAPTIEGHHYYKACGERVSTALEMAERLLEKGYPNSEVDDLLKQTIETEFPHVDSWINIEHVKLDGKVFHLGPALVEDFDSERSYVRFRRVFRSEGVYDGLKVPKQQDDYAVTEAKIGEWHFKTRYFSKEGKIKGTYINLNTPIELYPYGIRYVDLEVDVCVWPDGRVETLDEEKLQDALSRGVVTEKLVAIVKEKSREAIHNANPTVGSSQAPLT